MGGKEIILTFYRQDHLKDNWKVDLGSLEMEQRFKSIVDDLARFDITLKKAFNDDFTIKIASYADLLNSVRITSFADGFASLCVGHIIGKSQNLDLMEDIGRAVNRIAFAPETIPPDDHNRKVCHNCGCGC